jgi:hypothetical protein
MKATFKKIIDSNLVFGIIAAIFIFSLTIATQIRAGKDLKVGLYGVAQVSEKKSPYDNPLDLPRPLFRYAPGFAILQSPFFLKSEMIAPFEFKNIALSVFAWYAACILSLFFTGFLLLRLIPPPARKTAFVNLKLSFLMALPLIGYELSNGQNKLIALFFMVAALFFFEKNKMLLSSFFFNLALTVYIPLFAFLFYFILRSRGKFILDFIVGTLLVFFILPSLVLGFDFNLFLLKDWFLRCLKPFFATSSYASYVDLRVSSQALPSVLGRFFVSGHKDSFKYLISPLVLHLLVRFFSAIIMLSSCLAIWKQPDPRSRGLGYAIFLILSLILPQYCIYYTWAWLFVIYFAVFNYTDHVQTRLDEKKILNMLVLILFVSSWLISVHFFNRLSLLFWATLALWLGLAVLLIRESFGNRKKASYAK